MVRKIVLIAGCLLFFSLVSWGQSSLLWKITGEEGDAPSYLYGTHHMICGADFFIPKGVEAAFKTCTQLVMELDMDDPEMMQAMQRYLVMQDGLTLPEVMSEQEYELVNGFFQDSLGMGLSALANWKPFVLQTLVFPKLLGCSPKSYEMHFLGWATKAGMSIEGLETMEYQMSLFDSVSYETQSQWLAELVANFEDSQVEAQRLVEYYVRQDVDDLYEYVTSSMAELKEYEGMLLSRRNETWVPLMEVYMNQGSSFFAVGAAHLGGEEGLIVRLREAGYTVTPVKK